jgi:hypothetical protein
MVRAGLGYLAAADTGQLAAATQAECLRELEQAEAVLTAARAFVLVGFIAGQGYADDADYSARSWLIHHTHITPLVPPSGIPPGPSGRAPIRRCWPRWLPGRYPSRWAD